MHIGIMYISIDTHYGPFNTMQPMYRLQVYYGLKASESNITYLSATVVRSAKISFSTARNLSRK